MWKNRLFGGVVLATMLAATAMLATSATATPTKKQETVKLGFITKFPVDFFFTLENAAKKWDKAQPGREGALRPGQERHG